MPSQIEVGKNIGLTQTTISMHLNSIELTELVDPFKFFGDNVMVGLMQKAEEGDPMAIKLFFNVVYGWAEKKNVELKADVKTQGNATVQLKMSDDTAKKIGDLLAREPHVGFVNSSPDIAKEPPKKTTKKRAVKKTKRVPKKPSKRAIRK